MCPILTAHTEQNKKKTDQKKENDHKKLRRTGTRRTRRNFKLKRTLLIIINASNENVSSGSLSLNTTINN